MIPPIQKGKSSFPMAFGHHRNANEHDHKFGILLPPTAASNEWRRNVPCQRACKRWKAGNPIHIWLLETWSTFNATFKRCFGKAFIL